MAALVMDGTSRLATSVGGSLALHLLLIAAVSLVGPPLGRPAVVKPPRLTVELAQASPAPQHVPAEFPSPPAPSLARSVPDSGTRDARDAASALPGLAPIPLHVPEPKFYSLAELDAPPAVIQDVDADPPELKQYPQGGKLIVQLWIDETGKVVKTDILSSDLPEAFAASASDRFMRAMFNPARKGGAAVKARVSAAIVYQAQAR